MMYNEVIANVLVEKYDRAKWYDQNVSRLCISISNTRWKYLVMRTRDSSFLKYCSVISSIYFPDIIKQINSLNPKRIQAIEQNIYQILEVLQAFYVRVLMVENGQIKWHIARELFPCEYMWKNEYD